MKRRPAPAAALGLLLGIQFVIFIAGALSADPGSGIAAPDLKIVQRWLAGGRMGDLSSDPGHLAKPGYLLLLRLALPHGGLPGELRRLLVFNALWVWTGIAVLCLALWRRGARGASLSLAAMMLLCVQLRDAADWIAPEPFAIGFALHFAAALVSIPPEWWIPPLGLGCACALLLLVRPNLGATLVLVALVVFVTAAKEKRSRGGFLLLGFAAGIAALYLLGRTTGLPLDPRSMMASKSVLYGTAEYLWPPDLAPSHAGGAPPVTERAMLDAARSRWSNFFGNFGPDQLRSLLWRLTHPILSTEQYPARWRQPLYFESSRFLRRWWWIAGMLLSGLAVASAAGSRSEWRFIPLLLLFVMAGQAILFGAETRFALPLLPLLMLGIALSLATFRPGRGAFTAAAVTVIFLAAVVWEVPDTVSSDYAVARKLDEAIRQYVPRSRFLGRGPKMMHLRILASVPTAGLELRGNGELLVRRSPGEAGPYPAFLSVPLSGEFLERAQREGVSLEVRPLGDPGGMGFLYFPVIPDLFGPGATRNDDKTLPSGYGGWITGSFPVWTHDGGDLPRP